MVDKALVQKWKEYVANGGNLIISPRTGAKNKKAHLWESNLSGIMNNLIGGQIKTFDMLPSGVIGKVIMDGNNYEWRSWGEQIIAKNGTQVVGTYADQFYKGTACVLKKEFGEGKVWYIGIESTNGKLELDILKAAFKENNVEIEDFPEGVFVQYRDGFIIAVNYSSEEYLLPFNGAYLFGDKMLKPTDVAVWVKDKLN